jgi:hypothetical protein
MGRNFDESERAVANATTAFLEQLMMAQKSGSAVIRQLRLPVNDQFSDVEFFRTDIEPAISVMAYVERTVAYMRCTPECFVFAAAYLRRAADAGFPLNLRTIHRIFITALVVAAKVRDDLYYSMSYYGQIGGVSARDLGRMELHFLLSVISFEANVSVQEYATVCSDMGRALALRSVPASVAVKALPAVSSEGGLSSGAPSGATSPVVEALPLTGAELAWTSQAKLFFPLC